MYDRTIEGRTCISKIKRERDCGQAPETRSASRCISRSLFPHTFGLGCAALNGSTTASRMNERMAVSRSRDISLPTLNYFQRRAPEPAHSPRVCVSHAHAGGSKMFDRKKGKTKIFAPTRGKEKNRYRRSGWPRSEANFANLEFVSFLFLPTMSEIFRRLCSRWRSKDTFGRRGL